MVVIKIFDDKEIDPSSSKVKAKISESITRYILDNWDKCVEISSNTFENNYEVEFKIKL